MKSKITLSLIFATTILSSNANAASGIHAGGTLDIRAKNIYIDPSSKISARNIIVNGKRYNSVAEMRADIASGKISRQQLAHQPNVNRQNLTLRVDPNKIQFKDNIIYIGGRRADDLKKASIDYLTGGGNAASLNQSDIEFKDDGMFVQGIKLLSKEQMTEGINRKLTNISDQRLKEEVEKDPYFLAMLDESSKQQVMTRLQALEADNAILEQSNEHLNKFESKKQETFAGNPKLLSTYDRLINMEPDERRVAREQPEFQELLNSQELASLNNSAEMQEMLKEEVNKVNEKAAAGKPNARERFVRFINEDKDLFLTDTSKAVARLSDLTPVQKPDTLTTDSMLTSIGNVTDVLDTRIAEVTTEPLGVSSGEGSMPYGLWVKGMYSHANQSEYKLVPGYKLDQGGGTIGFDIGENAIFGVAYSYIDSTAKTKNIGIKEKIKSHIGTIYGLFNADNNIFLDGQARYGKSDIKKSRANGNLSNDVSRGKTKGELYGGKVELGYDYTLENKVHLIPSLGVSHDELKVKGYQETGSGLNRKVSKRTASKTSGIVGLRVKQAIETGSFTVIPEVHANLIYAMDTKNGKTTITFLEGMDPITTPSGKLPKASYKIGGSLRFTQFKTVDFGIGYDLGISKKFYSHTGSLNARVNF